MRIARLVAADAAAYRALMLEAYVQAADAFTSTAQERAAEPLAWWQRRIGSPGGLSEAFGAFAGQGEAAAGAAQSSLVGCVAVEYASKPKTRHSAMLIGMYVQPGAREAGVGARLVEAAVAAARARAGIEVLTLTVTEGNEPALRLYRAAGFVAWGTEPLAIRTPGGFRGKVHMALRLGGTPASH